MAVHVCQSVFVTLVIQKSVKTFDVFVAFSHLFIFLFQFSLPPPKGGKHSNNPILVEDQRMPQQRPSKKSLQKMCIFDENYVARASPFKIHDLTSRAAQLGIWGEVKPWNKRNPNEVGKKFKKKRK